VADSDSKKNDGNSNKSDNKDVVEVPGKPEKAEQPKRSSGGKNWLAAIALLLAVAAIAISAYQWQLGFNSQQQLAVELATLDSRVDSQAQDGRTVQRAIDRQTEVVRLQQEKLLEQINQLKQQLNSQHKRILSLSTTDRNDWLLAEAEYLIRLANQRLLMGKEITGAKDLLIAAADIIKELDDSALHSVRKALANDVATLNAANKLDVEWLYLRLGAAAQQIDQLRLFEAPVLSAEAVEETTPDNWQQRFLSGLEVAWEKLKTYLQIRRRDEIYQPALAPEYEAAVRQNVRLMLEQGQMALLAGKQRLYEDSLNKASHWIKTYYTLDASASQAVLASIDDLKQQQVEIVLPDISASLRALKDYMDMMHDVSVTLPPAKSSEPVAEQSAGKGA
jgi:uroporphyrin-3 C-methyltransferase